MKQRIQDTEASKEELLTVLTQMAECFLQQNACAPAKNESDKSTVEQAQSSMDSSRGVETGKSNKLEDPF
jgi:hypothetical protein